MLAALGVKIELTPEEISRCIREAGIGFMFAPAHHPAMKHVGPTRVELGTRTIFNLLGPLSNPAGVKRQMVGVFARPLDRAARQCAWARSARSAPGSCMAPTASTRSPPPGRPVAELSDGKVKTYEIKPEDVGLKRAKPEELRGGDAAHNAEALRGVLAGKPGAFRDVALFNAAAALLVAGKAKSLKEGA